MGNFFKSAWSDIKNRKNLELYLILVVSLAVLGADIFGIETKDALFEIVLAALSILIYGLIDSRQAAERIEKKLDETSGVQNDLIRMVNEIPRLIFYGSKATNFLKFQISLRSQNLPKMQQQ